MHRVRVALLGWAGSRPDLLAIPAKFYRDAGAEVFIWTPSVLRGMLKPRGWKAQGKAMLNAWLAEEDDGLCPLLIHSFSNGGFWNYTGALEEMNRPDSPHFGANARLIGVIFDSSPGIPPAATPAFFLEHSVAAMTSIILAALGRVPRIRHPLLSPALYPPLLLWAAMHPERLKTMAQSLDIATTLGPRSTLLLYSGIDLLVPAQYVESFAKALSAAGGEVALEKFKSSAHVVHFFRHRRLYFERIQEWLAPLLADQETRTAER